MVHPSLQPFPPPVLRQIALLAAEIIEHAASFGSDRWGLTPYSDGIRVNVGWTEILTAFPDSIELVLDGARAREAPTSTGVLAHEDNDPRGFYPTIPGSVKAVIQCIPLSSLEQAIGALRPALFEAIRLAAKRRAGKGVKAGHRQEVVDVLATLAGRPLPSPGDAPQSHVDVNADESLMEGALRRVVSSVWERDPDARDACIEHYGTSCFVCGFSFEAVFGEFARGFIHVHHLTPLSSVRKEHAVNPIADLRPVCPNCHAMLHRDPPLTIEALQAHIAKQNEAK